MPGGWANSQRGAELPANWPALRAATFERDGHQCTWHDQHQRCAGPADECDHVGDSHDHSLSNLRALCAYHHSKRTSTQGNTARWAHREQRPPEPHPGLRTT